MNQFHISITPFYPPLASCQLYRVDITYRKIYQGYFDFCYSATEEEFKGVRRRIDDQWAPVEDWYPTFHDYLNSIRPHVFDIQYGRDDYSMEPLLLSIEEAWKKYKVKKNE